MVTRKWNIAKDKSSVNYRAGNEITYSTNIFKDSLCDYNDAFMLVRGNNVVGRNLATEIAFKGCAPFIKCITKIDGATIENAEDLDLVVMPMRNLLEYSSNYSDTTGSLWLHSKDKKTNFNANIFSSITFKSFEYKTGLRENTIADEVNGFLGNATITVPLKYLSNFWRPLEMPLINCKVELNHDRTNHCVLYDNADSDPNIIFTIKVPKLYFPIATSSAKYNQKLLKLPGKEFERSLHWNEYKTKSE